MALVSNRDFVYHGKAYKDQLGRVHLEMTSAPSKNTPKTSGGPPSQKFLYPHRLG